MPVCLSFHPLLTHPCILEPSGKSQPETSSFTQWPELSQMTTSIKEFISICLTFLPNWGSVDRNKRIDIE